MEQGIELKPSIPIEIDEQEREEALREELKDRVRCSKCSRLVLSVFESGVCIFCYRKYHGKSLQSL